MRKRVSLESFYVGQEKGEEKKEAEEERKIREREEEKKEAERKERSRGKIREMFYKGKESLVP